MDYLQRKDIVKSPKLFISHKSEDLPFVKELVRMLEFIVGSDGDKIFCSSISGYDIKPGREILSELKRQFDEHEIYFIAVHSPRYYHSPICLNEMGAAWVLGTRFCSLLTSDCSYNMLKGAIDNRYISIKVNDEQETVVSKLNYFKDELLKIFSIDKFNNNRWENVRNEFIERTCEIKYDQTEDTLSSGNSTAAKAEIIAEVINTSPVMIDISNQGDGTAENLNIILDDACNDMILTGLELFPLDFLKKGKHVRLNWYRCFGDPDKFTISFTWKENGVAHSSKELIYA